MLVFDLTLGSPEENLACDEALLDLCEEGLSEPVLRFWSPEQTFVVVGYANHVAVEVNVARCQQKGVPILRRCTGGGTVVQAPGCLNYTAVLRIDANPKLAGIPGTNEFVMERTRAAVQRVTDLPITLEGHTDLAVFGRKFCGNAQRRRKHCLIFHGCFLLNCDLSFIEDLLPMPSKQPGYRQNRSHGDFVRTLPVGEQNLKRALTDEWSARDPAQAVPLDRLNNLVLHKYSREDWNFKF